MLNLITDRTNADVSYAQRMKGKKWADLTSEQKAEYLLGLKGAYSYTDFNRVENAVAYLSELLKTYGYENTVNVKTNWTSEDMQKVSEIQRYIDNIAELKNKYYTSIEGTMPTTATWLTVEGANYLEKLLANIEEIIINMTQNFIHCGVANCGQNRVWQNKFRRQNWLPVKYELTNLISDPSFENNQWSGANYSTVEKLFDSRSLYFPTGTTVIASIVIDRPIVSHKYYGRRYIKTNGNNQPADCRFEVYGGDGANLNWVYAWNNGNHQEWEFGSAIHEITAVGYAENVNTIIRCFNVNTTTNTWIDGVMLIDLTDCFGEGKEPTKQWCDEHIPFFEGTQIIEVKENIKEG